MQDRHDDRTTMMAAEIPPSQELLERELWLLALCWLAGWNLPWTTVHRWVEGLARTCPIRARA